MKFIENFLSDVRSWIMMVGMAIAWIWSLRAKKIAVEKSEAEKDETQVGIAIKVQEFKDKRWEEMTDKNEELRRLVNSLLDENEGIKRKLKDALITIDEQRAEINMKINTQIK